MASDYEQLTETSTKQHNLSIIPYKYVVITRQSYNCHKQSPSYKPGKCNRVFSYHWDGNIYVTFHIGATVIVLG